MSEDTMRYPSSEEMREYLELQRRDNISRLAKELFVRAVTAVDKDGRSVLGRYKLAGKQGDVIDSADAALKLAAIYLEQQQEYFK